MDIASPLPGAIHDLRSAAILSSSEARLVTPPDILYGAPGRNALAVLVQLWEWTLRCSERRLEGWDDVG